MRSRRVLRRCLGCRQSDDKDKLLRIVFREGKLGIDEAACQPGRGGYVHRARACLHAVQSAALWERNLRIPRGALQKDAVERLLSEVKYSE